MAGVDAAAVMWGRWLERLFDALQNDQMPYIERPGERWGELRVTPAMSPHGLNPYGSAQRDGRRHFYDEQKSVQD
jgi:hypothetical protein